jgi:putative membrane-bound dehydrogenase-like protein
MHPIAMTWDERGRLFVLITKDYPNERKPEGGSDYILLCEDTNGDGTADKFTRFAEGLSIPTGLVACNGGLIVSQAPHMLYLKDTNGDDKADEKKILFTGFGTFDTHAGPSNLHYGFDNWIWGSVGYSGFKGKVGDADTLRFGQGFFPVPSRWFETRIRDEYLEQHLGLCLQRNRRRIWLNGQQRPRLVHGHSAPVLRFRTGF